MKPISSKTAYQGRVSVEIEEHSYPDNQIVQREIVRKDDAVAVVVYDNEFLYLIEQPREAVREDQLLELVAGTMDVPGESELKCAQRELEEEIGYQATDWEKLTTVYTSPGFTNEQVTIFKASGLKKTAAAPDTEEKIELVKVPITELDQLLQRVTDAKTLIGLLWVHSHLNH